MNPHQKNKVDINRLFRLYGKLPSRSDHFSKHLKERKYFDSGDYAMSKAGKGDSVDTGTVGSQHPVPEKIPHLSSPPSTNTPGSNGHSNNHNVVGGSGSGGVGGITLGIPGSSAHFQQAGSPVKESSFLHRETSASDLEEPSAVDTTAGKQSSPVGQGQTESIPIRR
ncbi:cAMP-regulated phosphoprotein family protein Igo1 [Sporothrix brasiliensis 5110]|uniref:mRNA stability protein n=1 Tax=Sporothrix brasiliensis 5110 TaxID=1398154 RepID=A0A0C2IBY3_9PEZI|nr:cAMP-regulated phosphoprotein family protein Igo1 [Sporothrix brasiliensis 5110]KIH86786.1 cAMP-regulated phosphoprotein family protein Igo1 [Sporothrix brasiliensis 5110]